MLKAGKNALVSVLSRLFNMIFKSGHFPDAWRTSLLTPIHKKGDKHVTDNYRAIAVSSNICKLFCHVLYERPRKFLADNNVIPENQIAFQKRSRISEYIPVLKTLIDKYIHKATKSYMFVCFVDFKAAFDSVWRNALMMKLMKHGIQGQLMNIIENMYSSVIFVIKCKGGITKKFTSSVGVKQGCVLSPILFNYCISDLPSICDDTCTRSQLADKPLSYLLYADDLVIMSETAKRVTKCPT